MLLTSSTEKILDKEQITNEKAKHKEVHEFIYESKIKAKTEIFKITEIDNFINFLNSSHRILLLY